MDIGDERNGNALPDGLQGFRRPLVGNGQPDNLAARSLQTPNLGDRPLDLMGQRLGHRLDNDRGPSPDRHVADHKLLRASPRISENASIYHGMRLSQPLGILLTISLRMTKTIRKMKMTKPTCIQICRTLGLKSRRKRASRPRTNIWPPSNTGIGKRLMTPSWRLIRPIQLSMAKKPICQAA